METGTLRERLRTGMKDAVRARDRARVAVLRTVVAAIDNAEAVPMDTAPAASVGRLEDAPRRRLDDEEVIAVVQAEREERLAAAALYERHDQSERAADLRAEARVIASYLA